MSQHDDLLYEMDKRGGRITTAEILQLKPSIAQYNRVISDLRHKRGFGIDCDEILTSNGKNNIFRITHDPRKKVIQKELF